MKNHTKKRGFLAGLGAMVAVAALALGGSAATAAPLPMPQQSGLVITKLEQPATAGTAAPGTQQDVSAYTPIPDVEFEAYAVPVTGTPGTNTWLQNMANTTLAQAQTAIGGSPVAVRTGTTDANGVILWQTGEAGSQGDDLPWGLYLIRETDTPDDVVAAGDFLVAVPLTDPADRDEWLTDIFVYPKNATIDATKTVVNAADLIVGNTVTWTIDTAIPQLRANTGGSYIATDAFEIHDTLQDDELSLNETAPATGITVTAPAGLVKGATPGTGDYYVVTDTAVAGETTYQIVFTAAGRQKLADALNNATGERVTVTLDTKVLKAAVIANEADVYPNQKSITDSTPLTTDPVEVRYGAYQLNKKSSASPAPASLAGAQFKVYSSKAAADASGTDNLRPEVTGTGYDPVTGVWTTDAGGVVSVAGLRYTDFADGAVQTRYIDDGGTCADYAAGGDDCAPNPKYQSYWLVEVTALGGHQLLAEPIEFVVNADSATQLTQEIVNQHNRNGFVLPLTGGMGTVILTIGGIAILAVVLIVARRRRSAETSAE
ncbi:MAG: SpaH/EbpB family LPXTG-anchored major pilin [Leucobacter sp.]